MQQARRMAGLALAGLMTVAGGVAPSVAGGGEEPVRSVAVIADLVAVAPGGTVTVGVQVRLAEGWHTYWRNPGDSGMAPRLAWKLPAGWSAGELRYPAPLRIEEPPFVTFGYEGEVLLLCELTAPSQADTGTLVRLEGTLHFLICKEICVPRNAGLELQLEVAAVARPAPEAAAALVAAGRQRLPQVLPDWTFTAALTPETVLLRVRAPAGVDLAALQTATFFPEAGGLLDYLGARSYQVADGVGTFTFKRSGEVDFTATRLRGVLVTTPSAPALLVDAVIGD